MAKSERTVTSTCVNCDVAYDWATWGRMTVCRCGGYEFIEREDNTAQPITHPEGWLAVGARVRHRQSGQLATMVAATHGSSIYPHALRWDCAPNAQYGFYAAEMREFEPVADRGRLHAIGDEWIVLPFGKRYTCTEVRDGRATFKSGGTEIYLDVGGETPASWRRAAPSHAIAVDESAEWDRMAAACAPAPPPSLPRVEPGQRWQYSVDGAVYTVTGFRDDAIGHHATLAGSDGLMVLNADSTVAAPRFWQPAELDAHIRRQYGLAPSISDGGATLTGPELAPLRSLSTIVGQALTLLEAQPRTVDDVPVFTSYEQDVRERNRRMASLIAKHAAPRWARDGFARHQGPGWDKFQRYLATEVETANNRASPRPLLPCEVSEEDADWVLRGSPVTVDVQFLETVEDCERFTGPAKIKTWGDVIIGTPDFVARWKAATK